MNGPAQTLSKTKHIFAAATATATATTTTTSQYVSLLQHYGATKSLTKTKQLHAHTIISSFLSSQRTTHLLSIFAASYALCGYIPNARQLFDQLPERSLFLYNAMVRMYAQNGLLPDVIKLFVEMIELGKHPPDNFTYPIVFKACGELGLIGLGVTVHGRLVKDGFESGTFVKNSLVAMYMSCREKELARRAFEGTWERSVVSWNTMISGYFKNGCAGEALMVFEWMADAGVEPDCATVVSVLPACGCLNDLNTGRRVHEMVEEKALGSKIEVRNALVDMYVKCGSINEARMVFDKMDERDVVTWTAMINGYLLNGDARNALALCRMMQFEGVRPNSVTVASLLSACASLESMKDGQSLHGWATRHKLESDLIVETALIDMYAKCNHVGFSFRVFSKTSRRRTSPWNAVLSGCIHNGLAREAIEFFKEMLMEAVDPDGATLNSVLPAYAILADLQQGMNVHGYLIRSGFFLRLEVATGLIDIYSKCGSLGSAHKIFNGIPEKDKDIISWSAILAGYGMHGHGLTAISLFSQMVLSGVKPNEITFTSALHACSHAGLVDEGLALFKFMLEDHKTCCRTNHYTCIVDLLGRAGRLDEAYNLIKTMPFQPNHAIWGALLGACAIHENVELGEVAAKSLFELEPENTGNYVLMAKIYAAAGRWKDAEDVRHMMNEIGLSKAPAQSFIEMKYIKLPIEENQYTKPVVQDSLCTGQGLPLLIKITVH